MLHTYLHHFGPTIVAETTIRDFHREIHTVASCSEFLTVAVCCAATVQSDKMNHKINFFLRPQSYTTSKLGNTQRVDACGIIFTVLVSQGQRLGKKCLPVIAGRWVSLCSLASVFYFDCLSATAFLCSESPWRVLNILSKLRVQFLCSFNHIKLTGDQLQCMSGIIFPFICLSIFTTLLHCNTGFDTFCRNYSSNYSTFAHQLWTILVLPHLATLLW